MAKTISNLLVGIGFDLDKKSTDNVSSGIDSIKSKALKLGSIVAGAFGIKALTADFADAKDDLGKFAEVFGSTADNINAFGAALRLEGGTLQGFMSQLANLEKFRAGLAVGDAGFIAAAGRAGLDTQALIEAKNATEGYLTLANQFQRMTRQQRINAADALGLDEASIRLLSKGRKGIEKVVEQQRRLRPITLDMTEEAAKFNDNTQMLLDNMGAVADKFSLILMPSINEALESVNEWFDKNRDLSLVEMGGEVSKKAFFGAGLLESFIANREKAGVSPNNINTTSVNNQFPRLGDTQRPIVVKANFTMDGKVIDSKVIKVVGEMADQAIQDLSSSEGG